MPAAIRMDNVYCRSEPKTTAGCKYSRTLPRIVIVMMMIIYGSIHAWYVIFASGRQ